MLLDPRLNLCAVRLAAKFVLKGTLQNLFTDIEANVRFSVHAIEEMCKEVDLRAVQDELRGKDIHLVTSCLVRAAMTELYKGNRVLSEDEATESHTALPTRCSQPLLMS